jgi:hypothetical protein
MEKVPCPMRNTEHCPIFLQEGECYEDKHHVYWPSNEYTTRTEKQFRLLGSKTIEMCRFLHNTLHAIALPPEHPTVAEMRREINKENGG